MVLKVSTFRGVDIDMSQLTLGDMLIIELAHGESIHLLPVRSGCSRRWLYAKSTWLTGDSRRVDELCSQNAEIKALDGYGSLKSGSVDVYVPLKFLLDQPLSCLVEVRWPDDAKGRERIRTLGKFMSTGGHVIGVSASTLRDAARTR